MNHDKRTILMMCSHLLGYPSEKFIEEHKELEAVLLKEGSLTVKQHIVDAYAPLNQLSRQKQQEVYVETFDLTSALGLYLTAHEYGDSTKRGAALIKLQKLVNQAGFERVEGELADYMPMLLELLAVTNHTSEHQRLMKRMAVAVQRMVNSIDLDNPYAGILQLLMKFVFPNPTKQEIEKLEFTREEADLETLPYPIMYQ